MCAFYCHYTTHNNHFTTHIHNLCYLALPVKNWNILLEERYCLSAISDRQWLLAHIGLGRRHYSSLWCYAISVVFIILRRYARMVFAVVMCPSIHHKPVLYRNNWTDRADFWNGAFHLAILHCVVRKFGYFQKLEYFPLEICPKLQT